MLFVFAIVTVPSLQAGEPEAHSVDKLTWMAGSWLQVKDGVETEEYWTEPKGDVLLGIGRTVRGPGKTTFEFMRIAKTPGGISYFASPQGRPAEEFPLAQLEAKKVVFEDAKRDFPRRISYWLDGDGDLRARLEGTLKGQPRSLEFHWKKRQ
jgi:hypothetical protein